MKITMTQATEIFGGLQQLDTYEKIARVGGADQVARVTYDFAPETRLSIAINLNRMKVIVQAHQDAAAGIQKSLADADGKLQPDKGREFSDQMMALARSTEDVKLRRIDVSAFRLDQNPIPPTVLAMIGPILKGVPADQADDEA